MAAKHPDSEEECLKIFLASTRECTNCSNFIHKDIFPKLNSHYCDRNISVRLAEKDILPGQIHLDQVYENLISAAVVIVPVCPELLDKIGSVIGNVDNKYIFINVESGHGELTGRLTLVEPISWHNENSREYFWEKLIAGIDGILTKGSTIKPTTHGKDNVKQVTSESYENKYEFVTCGPNSPALISKDFLPKDENSSEDTRSFISKANNKDYGNTGGFCDLRKHILDLVKHGNIRELCNCIHLVRNSKIRETCLQHLLDMDINNETVYQSVVDSLPESITILMSAYLQTHNSLYLNLQLNFQFLLLLLLNNMIVTFYSHIAQTTEFRQEMLCKYDICAQNDSLHKKFKEHTKKQTEKRTISRMLLQSISKYMDWILTFDRSGDDNHNMLSVEAHEICSNHNIVPDNVKKMSLFQLIMCLHVLHIQCMRDSQKRQTAQQRICELIQECLKTGIHKQNKKGRITLTNKEARGLLVCNSMMILMSLIRHYSEVILNVDVKKLLEKLVEHSPETKIFVIDVFVKPCILLPNANSKDWQPFLIKLAFGDNGPTESDETKLYLQSLIQSYGPCGTEIHRRIEKGTCSAYCAPATIYGRGCRLMLQTGLMQDITSIPNRSNINKQSPSVRLMMNDIEKFKRLGNHENIAAILGMRNMNSPHLLPFYKFQEHPGNTSIGDNLFDALYKGQVSNLISCSKDALSAVKFCHSKEIILNRIIPANFVLFLDSKGNEQLMLKDLDVSIYEKEQSEMDKAKLDGLVSRYLPPEIVYKDSVVFNKSTDSYIFGCFLHSIFNRGAPPFDISGFNGHEIANLVVFTGFKLRQTPTLPKDVYNIILELTMMMPESRLSLDRLDEQLGALQYDFLDNDIDFKQTPVDAKFEDFKQMENELGIPKLQMTNRGGSILYHNLTPRDKKNKPGPTEIAFDEPQIKDLRTGTIITEKIKRDNDFDGLRTLKQQWKKIYKNGNPPGLEITEKKDCIETKIAQPSECLLDIAKKMRTNDNLWKILAKVARTIVDSYHKNGHIINDLKARYIRITGSGEVIICRNARVKELPNWHNTPMTERKIILDQTPDDIKRWSGKETLCDNIRCLASDVYSFGVVLWEVFIANSRHKVHEPWSHLQIDELLDTLIKGDVLATQESMTIDILIKKMLSPHYSYRPSLQEVAGVLESENLEEHEMFRNLIGQTCIYDSINENDTDKRITKKLEEDGILTGYFAQHSSPPVGKLDRSKRPRSIAIHEEFKDKIKSKLDTTTESEVESPHSNFTNKRYKKSERKEQNYENVDRSNAHVLAVGAVKRNKSMRDKVKRKIDFTTATSSTSSVPSDGLPNFDRLSKNLFTGRRYEMENHNLPIFLHRPSTNWNGARPKSTYVKRKEIMESSYVFRPLYVNLPPLSESAESSESNLRKSYSPKKENRNNYFKIGFNKIKQKFNKDKVIEARSFVSNIDDNNSNLYEDISEYLRPQSLRPPMTPPLYDKLKQGNESDVI